MRHRSPALAVVLALAALLAWVALGAGTLEPAGARPSHDSVLMVAAGTPARVVVDDGRTGSSERWRAGRPLLLLVVVLVAAILPLSRRRVPGSGGARPAGLRRRWPGAGRSPPSAVPA